MQLRRRWQGTRQVSDYEIDWALAELEHALEQVEQSRRIMRRMLQVWPGVRTAVAGLEEWLTASMGSSVGTGEPRAGR
jgi:hypothetical protein